MAIPLINEAQGRAWAARHGLQDVWVRYMTREEAAERGHSSELIETLDSAPVNARHNAYTVLSWCKPIDVEVPRLPRPRGTSRYYLSSYYWYVRLHVAPGIVWNEYAPRLLLLTPDELERIESLQIIRALAELIQ